MLNNKKKLNLFLILCILTVNIDRASVSYDADPITRLARELESVQRLESLLNAPDPQETKYPTFEDISKQDEHKTTIAWQTLMGIVPGLNPNIGEKYGQDIPLKTLRDWVNALLNISSGQSASNSSDSTSDVLSNFLPGTDFGSALKELQGVIEGLEEEKRRSKSAESRTNRPPDVGIPSGLRISKAKLLDELSSAGVIVNEGEFEKLPDYVSLKDVENCAVNLTSAGATIPPEVEALLVCFGRSNDQVLIEVLNKVIADCKKNLEDKKGTEEGSDSGDSQKNTANGGLLDRLDAPSIPEALKEIYRKVIASLRKVIHYDNGTMSAQYAIAVHIKNLAFPLGEQVLKSLAATLGQEGSRLAESVFVRKAELGYYLHPNKQFYTDTEKRQLMKTVLDEILKLPGGREYLSIVCDTLDGPQRVTSGSFMGMPETVVPPLQPSYMFKKGDTQEPKKEVSRIIVAGNIVTDRKEGEQKVEVAPPTAEHVWTGSGINVVPNPFTKLSNLGARGVMDLKGSKQKIEESVLRKLGKEIQHAFRAAQGLRSNPGDPSIERAIYSIPEAVSSGSASLKGAFYFSLATEDTLKDPLREYLKKELSRLAQKIEDDTLILSITEMGKVVEEDMRSRLIGAFISGLKGHLDAKLDEFNDRPLIKLAEQALKRKVEKEGDIQDSEWPILKSYKFGRVQRINAAHAEIVKILIETMRSDEFLSVLNEIFEKSYGEAIKTLKKEMLSILEKAANKSFDETKKKMRDFEPDSGIVLAILSNRAFIASLTRPILPDTEE